MARIIKLARRAVVYEWGIWRSLYRWILRRPEHLEPGASTFSYVGAVRPMLITLIVVSAIEVPVLDVILRHTVDGETVRTAALALGVFGLFWMLGLLAGMQVTPHALGAARLHVRSGTTIRVSVPWEAVAGVSLRRRSPPGNRTALIEGEPDSRVLSISTGGQTNIDVELRSPHTFRLPAGDTEPVVGLRFYADDPDALVACARSHLGAAARSGGMSTGG